MRRVRCSSCVLAFVALVAFAVVLAACGSSSSRPSIPTSVSLPSISRSTTTTTTGETTTTTAPETTTTTVAPPSTSITTAVVSTSTTGAPTTTTTAPPTTSTTGAPTTTTTEAPTTTTTEAATTTTTEAPGTTTSTITLPVTTTPEPSDTETTWALVLAGIAALGLLIVGIVTIVRHNQARKAARELWRTEGPRVIGEVTTTIAVLGGVASGTTQLSVASDAVRRVTASLEELAAVKLNDEATDAANTVAARLRSNLFDVEADNLLREQNPAAPRPAPRPTSPELVDGVARIRAQVEALDHPESSGRS
jgi:hypothetical protein